MEGEHDPVVHRMNVFLSKRLCKNLLLLQYPVRAAAKTYDEADVVSARVKPRQHCVELELAVDVKGHCHETGDSQMSKLKLTSSPSGAEMSRYVVGVVNNDELHLTPLSDVVQLRPCYGYLDNAEPKSARGASASAAGAAGESSHDEGDDDARPVTVRFAPHESEDALARRMASYEHFKRQVDEEAWVGVRHCAVDSYESHIGRLHLMAEKKQESTEFYVTPAKFLNRLIPCPEAEVSAVASLPSNVLSLAALKAMPRDERIRSLMRSVRAIRFSELLSVLKSLGEQQVASSTEFVQDVLRHVQHCAVLVQGCWVVKSEMLYAKDSVSDQTGASSNVLRNARDYILYRFHQETRPDDRVVVTRRDVADNVGPLSTEDEREILDKIARRSAVKRGWEFRFERDQDFIGGEYYRFVAKAQESYWQKQDLHWQKLQAAKKQTLATAALSTSPTKSKRSRVRTKSTGVDRSMSDQSESDADNSMRTEEHGGSMDVVPDDCVIVNESASNIIAQGAPDSSAADPVNEVDVASLLPLLVSSEPAVDLAAHVNSIDTEQGEQVSEAVRVALAEFAAERLRNHIVLSVNSLRTQLDLFRASLPVGHVLGMAGSLASTLDQALLDCGAIRRGERGGPDTVYMLPKRGDDHDVVRKCLIEILCTQKSLKLSSFKKMLQKTDCDVEYSDSDLRNILREYCVTAGGCWVLKETSRTTVD